MNNENKPKVIIQPYTTTNPISLIGEEAGICWGADITDAEKNYTRGVDCINANHGRAMEFPQIYMVLDGYDKSELDALGLIGGID